MYGFIFDLPNATDTMASMGTYAKPWFSELFPLAAAIVGILIAGFIIRFLMVGFEYGFSVVVERMKRHGPGDIWNGYED
jgi:hypothetical protein